MAGSVPTLTAAKSRCSIHCHPCPDALSTHRPCCSWLTWGYLGWSGLGVVYAFFWAAGLVQRWVGGRLAWYSGGWVGGRSGAGRRVGGGAAPAGDGASRGFGKPARSNTLNTQQPHPASPPFPCVPITLQAGGGPCEPPGGAAGAA
mgnify:CR=1 FL=1